MRGCCDVAVQALQSLGLFSTNTKSLRTTTNTLGWFDARHWHKQTGGGKKMCEVSGAECEANTRAPRRALSCVIGFIQVLSLHQEKREGGRWEGIKEKG